MSLRATLDTAERTPYLPAGWKREELPEANCAVYTEPKYGGMVTVDYAYRIFRLGLTTMGPRHSTGLYGGRGWRDQLEQDATAYLHEAVER